MSKYDFKVELADNTSTGMILKQIKRNSTVLEFGCANGRMTKYMKESKECHVYIVEIDPDAFSNAMVYAENGLCGDIEDLSWSETFKDIKFDFIIFADVLEHLRDPQRVLAETTKILKEDGAVIFSIPNIAHGDIYLNLYLNQFRYMPLGLLDNTHIHLFAYEELDEFCDRAGYGITVKDATIIDLFCTEQGKWIPDTYREHLKEKVFGKKYATVYQFIYKLQTKKYIIDAGIRETCNIKNDYYGIESYISYKIYNHEQISRKVRVYPTMASGTEYVFQLPIEKNTEKIIFEPVSNRGCILTNINILSNHGIINDFEADGHRYGDSIIFDKMNSTITIDLRNKYTYYLKVSAKIKPFEKTNDFYFYSNISDALTDLNTSLEQQLIKLDQKETEIRVLKSSQEDLLSSIAALNQDIDDKNEIIELKTQSICDLKNNLKIIESNRINQIHFLKAYMDRQDLDRQYEIDEKQNYISFLENQITILKNSIRSKINCEMNYSPKCEPIDQNLSVFYQKIRTNSNEIIITGNKRNCLNNVFSNNIEDLNNIEYDKIPLLERTNKKIAVHLHLFYEDLLPEFFNYFNNIPYVFDLYISCQSNANMDYIASKFSKLRFVNNLIVRKTENRGRDIAPFYILFSSEIQKHDYVLHVHSKKSLYSGTEQISWRKNMLNQLLGNEEIVKKIFSLFESNANIGLAFMENTDIAFWAQDWLANKNLGEKLCKEYNVKFDDGFFNYPVGSFFWAKVDALRPIFKRNLSYNDFPEEAGQTDGTLAHALERFIAFLVQNQKYNLAILDYAENTVRINRSTKAYRKYFDLTAEKALKYLKKFDVISFDIFDTLITRKIYRPDDLFRVIGQKVKNKLNMDIDFYRIRKSAESEVWNEIGPATDIHKIYVKFAQVAQIDPCDAERIKNIEIETELQFVIPRKDMLKLFNKLKDSGKTIILVSDMYLTSDIIEKLLLKCGYQGYQDLWVSCEKNARKDIGNIWKPFFEKYGQNKVVHVGDNLRSDIQILSDQGKNTFYVMNPITQFKLSDQYRHIKEFDNNDIAFSIIMGMLINEKLYNSPFIFDKNGEFKINQEQTAGYVAFGALLTCFMQWIASKSDSDTQLLFLAREGYVLKQLFDTFCKETNVKNIETSYFLTSRRSISMASIRESEDIVKILEQDYTGSLKNLLAFRLGILMEDSDLAEIDVHMPKNLESTMTLIHNNIPEIYRQANEEREAYLAYTNSILNQDKKWIAVDVGYSGTIQYFLSKMLQKKVDGLYLCTGHNIKPFEIGCMCEQIYSYSKENGHSNVQNKSLYLEAALQAPFGQLVKFEVDEENHVHPIYKTEQLMGKSIEKLQDGIKEFLHCYLSITTDVLNGESIDCDFAAELFNQYTNVDVMSEKLSNIFEIQDDYCVNGMLKIV